MRTTAFPLVALLATFACNPREPVREAPSAEPAAAAPAGDSLTSMPYLLRRFQAQVGEPPAALRHAASSPDRLAQAFLAALERRDTTALQRMIVSPSEFGHLYFPHSIFMRPPYELDPAVVWMQLDAASRTGMRRALREYGGRPAGYVSLECRPPDVHGTTRIHGCDVRRLTAPGDTVRDRLFGPILERDGRFKFLSLQNRL